MENGKLPWHDTATEPQSGAWVAYVTPRGIMHTMLYVASVVSWQWTVDKYDIEQWAYVDDLRPKRKER